MFDTKAVWNITLMFDVQNNFIGYRCSQPLYFLCASFKFTLNPCKYITKKNTAIVASKFIKFGLDVR